MSDEAVVPEPSATPSPSSSSPPPPPPPPPPPRSAVPPAPPRSAVPPAPPSAPVLPVGRVVPPEPAPADDVVEHVSSARPGFTPLRTDPPPSLFATWWLRYMLALAQLVSIVVVVLAGYSHPYVEIVRDPVVVTAHAMIAVLLVSWSALALADASRLVPATRYRRRSLPLLAVALWLVAFAAPIAALRVVEWARDRFAADADDTTALVVAVFAVAVSFFLVWLPFQYHTRQAHRIGAPGRVVAAWFWIPLMAAVGALAIDALGLHDWLADGGFGPTDRMVQVAVVYGLPALTFALCTWRATTVFDEVIELRWLRWKTEWEQTLVAMAAQPVPGPEIAPSLD